MAIDNNMYIEQLDDMYSGLRIKIGNDVSWVQYFGPDSHVKTRQTPYSMLSFCCKLSDNQYFKVGFKGILHLAHASIKGIIGKTADKMWDESFVKTEKYLGRKPGLAEAAKTTYIL